MSEYWKSTPKYECKCCRIWIPDTKIAKANHEAGVKHKEKFELLNKKKRDEKFHAERDQKNLQRQLAEIEVLAREALEGDRAQGVVNVSFTSSGIAPSSSSLNPRGARKADATNLDDSEGGNRPPVDNGMYTIRDQNYLEGKKNERHIIKGIGCEIFIEEADDWFKCSVTARRETIIPNTNLMFVSFDVEYVITTDDDGNTIDGGGLQPQVETNIKADRLRLLCDSSGFVMDLNSLAPPLEEEILLQNESIESGKKVSGGVGAWTTVSIIQYDEVEEERKAAAALLEEKFADELKIRKDREAAVVFNDREDDVLAQYDPYGTNVYKGIRLAEDTVALADTVDSIKPGGGSTAFKKRRLNGNGAARIKREEEE